LGQHRRIGVLVPTLVGDGEPRRKIIDGDYLMAIANELGYDCPEIGQTGLTEEEKRNKSQTQAPNTVLAYSS
jgi:hypothetical protein